MELAATLTSTSSCSSHPYHLSSCSGITNVHDLSTDLLTYIFSYLTPQELATVCRVCTFWNNICSDNELWAQVYKITFPDDELWGGNIYDWKETCAKEIISRSHWGEGSYSLRTLRGHSNYITSVGFVRNKILSGSRDSTVKIWDVDSGRMLRSLNAHPGRWVRCIDSDDDYLLTTAANVSGEIKIWKVDTLLDEEANQVEPLANWRCHLPNGICAATIKDTIVATGGYQEVKIWNWVDQEEMFTFPVNNEWIRGLLIVPNHNLLITSLSCHVMLFDLNSQTLIRKFKAHNSLLTGMQLRKIENENVILETCSPLTIKVWDLLENKCIEMYKKLPHNQFLYRFHLGRDRLVSASKQIHIYKLSTRKRLNILRGHSKKVTCLEYDGKMIVSGSSDSTINVYKFLKF